PSASTTTRTVVDSNAKTAVKKTTSAKTRRTRMRATEADASATAQAAADAREKSRINEESKSGFQDRVVNDQAPETVMAADHAGEAAMAQDNRVRNKLDAKTAVSALTAPQCAPLPNVTNPEDVDAHYYQNWAREYWCYDSTRSAAATRN